MEVGSQITPSSVCETYPHHNPDTDIMLVTRNGFPSAGGPVHLTNSITMADLPRLQHTSGCGQSRGWGQRSRDSELLLCKVFKGNHVEVKSREM